MANENRLISADRFCDFVDENCTDRHAALWKELIRRQPTVDAAPVVHGRWERVIPTKSAAKWSTKVSCSACHKQGYTHHKYCPNCGAKMYGGNEDG